MMASFSLMCANPALLDDDDDGGGEDVGGRTGGGPVDLRGGERLCLGDQ